MRKKRRKYDTKSEPYNRICPICGASVKKGSTRHQCKQEDIPTEEEEQQQHEDEYEELTYDDRLREGIAMLNQDDPEEEEEPNYY